MQPLKPSITLTLVAASALSAAASAQVNPFVFYPQDPERQTVTCTSFVGRPDGNLAAEALMEVNRDYFRGVGDSNGIVRVFGVYHWLADELLSTSETYDIVLRDVLPGGGPDMSPVGEIVRIQNLSSPPSTANQRGTWILYDGFGLGGGVLFNFNQLPSNTFYAGVDLAANPAWPATDGHSLFRADLLSANTSATLGENERLGAPNPTWAGKQGVPSFTTPWTYILGPLVTSPNLHVGGIDPLSSRLGANGANIGMNGLFPDVSGNPRSDGIMVRVTDTLAPGGLCFLGASLGFRPPVFHFGLTGILIGHSHIGTVPIPMEVGRLQAGVYEFGIATPGTVPTFMIGQNLVFQAIVWDDTITLAEWTNAQAVYF
ncbi:MAG: hypothetical protein KDE27_02205 [Planctomycetes bacterium]|nr:hypothetical protein [Planctomycetota bacterium]